MLGLEIAGLAASVGGSIFGAAKSSSAERAARRREASAHAKNEAYYKRQYNEDYADSGAGQALMRSAREYADRSWKRAQGAAAVGGGTEAGSAMAKESGNRVVSDTAGGLASRDVQRKDSALRGLVGEETRHAGEEAGAMRQQGANIASAASAMGNAVGGALDAVGGASDAAASARRSNLRSLVEGAKGVRPVGISEGVSGYVGSGLDGLRNKKLVLP